MVVKLSRKDIQNTDDDTCKTKPITRLHALRRGNNRDRLFGLDEEKKAESNPSQMWLLV